MKRALFVAMVVVGCARPVSLPRSHAVVTRTPRDEPAEASTEPATGDEVGPSAVAAAPPEEIDDDEAVSAFEGPVSYYSDALAGRPTASGEPYTPTELTAAHRRLPFGTRVRVTRLDTGASVIVRVNDRGPFGRRGRVLDLSRAAAEQLEMIERGVVDARVEVLADDPPPAP